MSGGHAFSYSDIDIVKSAGSDAVVEFVTAKTVLRPEAGFDVANAKEDLEATGYARVAVMAVNAVCIDAIKALDTKVCYTSPLLYGDDILEGSQIALYNNVLYVSVFKNGLHFAEAMTVVSDADILYYLESVHRVYGIYNMYARALGDVERLRRVCRKCFKTKL